MNSRNQNGTTKVKSSPYVQSQNYNLRRVPLVEQELLTLPEHLSSPLFLVGFVLRDL
jgi:hypothetical protein